MTALELLKKARTLISDPAHWTQGTFARYADGRLASEYSPKATQFCSLGALYHVAHGKCVLRNEMDAVSALSGEVGEDGIANFNDTHDHAEVLELFDRTIAKLEKRQNVEA